MNDRDAALNRCVIDAASALTDFDPDLGLIDPEVFEKLLFPHKDIRDEARKRSRGFLFRLGFVNKEFKTNVTAFLKRYDEYLDKVRAHNIPIMKKRLVDLESELSGYDFGMVLIDEQGLNGVVKTFADAKRDLLEQPKEYLHMLGVDDKGLRPYIDRFLDSYDVFPDRVREHNIPILKKLLSDASERMGRCDVGPILIYPKDENVALAPYTVLKTDILGRSKHGIHLLGLDDEAVKSDIGLFLKRYEDHPKVVRSHNLSVIRNRISDAASALSTCDSEELIDPADFDAILSPYTELKEDLCDPSSEYHAVFRID